MGLVRTIDLHRFGVIKDIEAHLLPMEAFNLGNNMRISGARMERIGSRTNVMTPSQVPYFIQMIKGNSGQIYWVYFSLTDAFVNTGGVETEITRVSGDYTAVLASQFNSTLLGGVPIFNTGVDVPQVWLPTSPGTKLVDLPVWDTGNRAKVFRAFGPYLNAYNVNIGGTSYPHLVWWAHPVDPGGTPISWNEADPTRDAGKKDLADTESGPIVDARLLRGSMYIYKERSTWVQRLIGGTFIFSFDTFLETSGILAPRCVATSGDGKWHMVATQDDVIVHDGNAVIPLLSNRMKRTLFNAIDINSYSTSFCFTHSKFNEIWLCYPETGRTLPNRALIWNYANGSQIGALTEADIDFQCAGSGDVDFSGTDTWDSESVMTWDGGPSDFWDSVNRQQVVIGKPGQTKLLALDWTAGTTNDGAPITGTLQRESLAIIGRRKDNSEINDFDRRKILRRLWLKGTGGPINVRIGYQTTVGGIVNWSTSQSFDPTTQLYLDFFVSGVALAVEFSAAVPFSISEYKMDLAVGGGF